jgi:hypothetical protein
MAKVKLISTKPAAFAKDASGTGPCKISQLTDLIGRR